MSSRLTRPKRVVLVPHERAARELSALGTVHPLVYRPGHELPPGASEAVVLVAQGIDPSAAPSLLSRLPKLEMVQLVSSGIDRWEPHIPAHVRLSNLTGVHGPAVAEWVMAQLLSHYRHLRKLDDDQRHRRWQQRQTETLLGKQVMIFGAGNIGQHLQALLAPFGTHTTLIGTSNRPGVVALSDSDSLLARADVVVLALPLTDRTRYLVDDSFLGRLKSQAVVVNVGRGQLVHTESLVHELQQHRLWAILDVTDPEPLPADHPLWTAPQVTISAHISAMTDDMDERTWRGIRRRIEEFVDTRPNHSDR